MLFQMLAQRLRFRPISRRLSEEEIHPPLPADTGFPSPQSGRHIALRAAVHPQLMLMKLRPGIGVIDDKLDVIDALDAQGIVIRALWLGCSKSLNMLGHSSLRL